MYMVAGDAGLSQLADLIAALEISRSADGLPGGNNLTIAVVELLCGEQ